MFAEEVLLYRSIVDAVAAFWPGEASIMNSLSLVLFTIKQDHGLRYVAHKIPISKDQDGSASGPQNGISLLLVGCSIISVNLDFSSGANESV